MDIKRTAVGLIAYILVVYGPWHWTCDPSTQFGRWCLTNSGYWVYREERRIWRCR